MRMGRALVTGLALLGSGCVGSPDEAASADQQPPAGLPGVWLQHPRPGQSVGGTAYTRLQLTNCRFVLQGVSCPDWRTLDAYFAQRPSAQQQCEGFEVWGAYEVLDPVRHTIRFSVAEDDLGPRSSLVGAVGEFEVDHDDLELFPGFTNEGFDPVDVAAALRGPWTPETFSRKERVMPGVMSSEPTDPQACLAEFKDRQCAASPQRLDCDGLAVNGCESVSWQQHVSCETAFPLGEVRGDDGHDEIVREGLGGGVFRLTIRESVSEWQLAPGRAVRAKLNLSSPSEGYGLEVLDDCATSSSGPPASSASLSWNDDDSHEVTVRVIDRGQSAACEGWILSIRGNE